SGLVDYARINDISLQAWWPLPKGREPGIFLGSRDYPELNAEIERLAAKYCVQPMAVACGWITRYPANMSAVLETAASSRIVDAAAGSDISLYRAEWYSVIQAAGHKLP